eukprot:scaffold154780_cov27-Tisochrysis_lutea.AAC.1
MPGASTSKVKRIILRPSRKPIRCAGSTTIGRSRLYVHRGGSDSLFSLRALANAEAVEAAQAAAATAASARFAPPIVSLIVSPTSHTAATPMAAPLMETSTEPCGSYLVCQSDRSILLTLVVPSHIETHNRATRSPGGGSDGDALSDGNHNRAAYKRSRRKKKPAFTCSSAGSAAPGSRTKKSLGSPMLTAGWSNALLEAVRETSIAGVRGMARHDRTTMGDLCMFGNLCVLSSVGSSALRPKTTRS